VERKAFLKSFVERIDVEPLQQAQRRGNPTEVGAKNTNRNDIYTLRIGVSTLEENPLGLKRVRREKYEHQLRLIEGFLDFVDPVSTKGDALAVTRKENVYNTAELLKKLRF